MAHILAVDDDLLVRTFVRVALEEGGHTVTAVASCAEALALVDAGLDHDLVLMDLMMHPIDGDDCIAALRSRPSARPIVLLTGFPQALRTDPATLAGVLEKPIVGSRLVAEVERVLAPSSPSPARTRA